MLVIITDLNSRLMGVLNMDVILGLWVFFRYVALFFVPLLYFTAIVLLVVQIVRSLKNNQENNLYKRWGSVFATSIFLIVLPVVISVYLKPPWHLDLLPAKLPSKIRLEKWNSPSPHFTKGNPVVLVDPTQVKLFPPHFTHVKQYNMELGAEFKYVIEMTYDTKTETYGINDKGEIVDDACGSCFLSRYESQKSDELLKLIDYFLKDKL